MPTHTAARRLVSGFVGNGLSKASRRFGARVALSGVGEQSPLDGSNPETPWEDGRGDLTGNLANGGDLDILGTRLDSSGAVIDTVHVVIENPPACPASVSSYGAGSPGSGGFVPAISLTGCPSAGASVTLIATQAMTGTAALLALGTGQGNIPIGNGATLLVDPLAGLVPLSIAGSGPGAGTLALPAVIPAGFIGTIALQLGVLDPGAPQGLAVTNGLLLAIP